MRFIVNLFKKTPGFAPGAFFMMFFLSLPAAAAVLDVTTPTFQQDVIDAPGIVLIQFDAKWCPYCKKIRPDIDALEKSGATKMKVVRVDIDKSPQVAGFLNVKSVPTLVVLRAGEELTRLEGAPDRDELFDWVKKVEKIVLPDTSKDQ